MLTLLVSGSAIAYVFFVFLPIQKSIAGLRSELDSKRKFILEAQQLGAKVIELEERMESARALVNDWREHAPSEDEMATFIGQLSVLASEAGATPGRITPRESIGLASLRRHPAELAVEGSFSQLSEFLRRLESLPKTVWITKLNIQPTRENGEALRCEITFSVFADNSGNSD